MAFANDKGQAITSDQNIQHLKFLVEIPAEKHTAYLEVKGEGPLNS